MEEIEHNVDFDYYLNASIDRLFRFDSRTGRQERWDAEPGTWVSVAPYLADDIYAGRVELDEVSAVTAKETYPIALGLPPTIAEDEMRVENTRIGEDTMIRIEMYVAQKLTIEEFTLDNEIVEPQLSAVKRYWLALQKEITER